MNTAIDTQANMNEMLRLEERRRSLVHELDDLTSQLNAIKGTLDSSKTENAERENRITDDESLVVLARKIIAKNEELFRRLA